jgi:glycosyltransferase involved in cell wall biosynthesis
MLTYPNAGLAIAATKTRGQEWIMSQYPDMGFLYDSRDVAALRNGLQKWIDHPELIMKAKRAARQAAEERFCWEKESPRFLECVEKVLSLKG